jgi:hypothetical protein
MAQKLLTCAVAQCTRPFFGAHTCSISKVGAEFRCATLSFSGIPLRYATLTAMVSVAAHRCLCFFKSSSLGYLLVFCFSLWLFKQFSCLCYLKVRILFSWLNFLVWMGSTKLNYCLQVSDVGCQDLISHPDPSRYYAAGRCARINMYLIPETKTQVDDVPIGRFW